MHLRLEPQIREKQPDGVGLYSSILIQYPKPDLIRTALSIKIDGRVVNEFSQITEGLMKLVVDDPTIPVDFNPIYQYLQKLVLGFVIGHFDQLGHLRHHYQSYLSRRNTGRHHALDWRVCSQQSEVYPSTQLAVANRSLRLSYL